MYKKVERSFVFVLVLLLMLLSITACKTEKKTKADPVACSGGWHEGYYCNEYVYLEFSEDYKTRDFQNGIHLMPTEAGYEWKIDICFDVGKSYKDYQELYNEALEVYDSPHWFDVEMEEVKYGDTPCLAIWGLNTAESTSYVKMYSLLHPNDNRLIYFIIFDWSKNANNLAVLDEIMETLVLKQ